MMHEIRILVCMLRVRLGLVLGRHPKINLFGLHYCVISRLRGGDKINCCKVDLIVVLAIIIIKQCHH